MVPSRLCTIAVARTSQMKTNLSSSRAAAICLICVSCIACLSEASFAQQPLTSVTRGFALDMLSTVTNDIRKNYYDPKLHGVDWDAKIAQTKLLIDKAPTMDIALSYIATAVDSLNDSHTLFYPPYRSKESDFGFEYQIIGPDRCYITHVRPQTDAAAKGLKPGDEILTVNNYLVDRSNRWKMDYMFSVLRPQASVQLRIQLPTDGSSRELQVNARITSRKNPRDLSWSWMRELDEERHSIRARFTELGDDVMVLKLPVFEYTNSQIGGMMARARKHHTLILDLRGNPGGDVDTLSDVLGALFEKDVKIADRVTRTNSKPWMAKSQRIVFTGKLIVLVDSDSASAAELLARVVQLEKRGIVVGDHTSGAVMESKFYRNQMGGDFLMFYGESITHANLIMTDGHSIEHIGVTPDYEIIPTAQDMANDRDPVLAKAAELAGVKLAPEEAGKMFPYEWTYEQ